MFSEDTPTIPIPQFNAGTYSPGCTLDQLLAGRDVLGTILSRAGWAGSQAIK